MLRKAQSITEIGIMAAIVALVTIATFTIYNNQKLKMVKMSSVTVASSVPSHPILPPTIVAETSGKASAPKFTGRTSDQYNDSVSSVSGSDLASHSDVLTSANDVGTKFSSTDSDQKILLSLLDQMNLISEKEPSQWTAAEKKFVANFTKLLNDTDDAVAALATTSGSHKPVNASVNTATDDYGSTYTVNKTTTTSSSGGGSSTAVSCTQNNTCEYNKHGSTAAME